jgi:hypothetical protein
MHASSARLSCDVTCAWQPFHHTRCGKRLFPPHGSCNIAALRHTHANLHAKLLASLTAMKGRVATQVTALHGQNAGQIICTSTTRTEKRSRTRITHIYARNGHQVARQGRTYTPLLIQCGDGGCAPSWVAIFLCSQLSFKLDATHSLTYTPTRPGSARHQRTRP